VQLPGTVKVPEPEAPGVRVTWWRCLSGETKRALAVVIGRSEEAVYDTVTWPGTVT
jgi:hypothetical protein